MPVLLELLAKGYWEVALNVALCGSAAVTGDPLVRLTSAGSPVCGHDGGGRLTSALVVLAAWSPAGGDNAWMLPAPAGCGVAWPG